MLNILFRQSCRRLAKNSICNLHTLPSQHAELEEVCRKFADKTIKPMSAKIDKLAEYPPDLLSKVGEMGLMGINAPREYCGTGLDIYGTSVAVEELARVCASTGALVSIHNILYLDFLSTYGNKYHKETFLPPYTQGIPGAFALSEFDAGSDVVNISTTAKKDGNSYIINGTKAWVTSGIEAEMAIVFATFDRSKGYGGLSAFMIPLKAEGVTKGNRERKMGIRATSTCTLTFTDVRIPEVNLVGNPGEGFRLAMEQLSKARIGIASQAVGIAQGCLDLALHYSTERSAFGKKLFNFQAVQLRLARMCAKIEAARLLVRKAATLCVNGEKFAKNSSMAKLMAAETANFCANECVQILGAMGYVEDMPAERYYRDAKITDIYGGVTDIQLKVIADHLLKESGLKK